MAKHTTVPHEHRSVTHHAAGADRAGILPRTEIGLQRIIYFSDAVIAIAITLLAIEIRLPDTPIDPSRLMSALLALSPRYVSFFISFFVIGQFWMSHHRVFEYIQTYDNRMIWINLIFLFLVAFVPFPTAVLGSYPAQLPSVIFYASLMVGLSLVRIGFWWYVYYRARLVRPETNPRIGRYEFSRAVGTAGVFGASILIALWNPIWAMWSWLLLIPITLMIRTPRVGS
ncbi:MAG TPA: TMEM175 family protein [Anaerolineaceae bacterium]|nr:TMEM175 family protein [Anaerolineaceae bacterium]